MKCTDIIIETPRGSAQKYSYDITTGFFKLKKILPAGMVFPYDFGFIPRTQGADGDPLDVLVLSEFHSFPGCVIPCHLIGGLKAMQSIHTGSKKLQRNDRLIGIPEASNFYKKIKSMSDLPKQLLKEIEDFFIDYNQIQQKKFTVLELMDAPDAWKNIRKHAVAQV